MEERRGAPILIKEPEVQCGHYLSFTQSCLIKSHCTILCRLAPFATAINPGDGAFETKYQYAKNPTPHL